VTAAPNRAIPLRRKLAGRLIAAIIGFSSVIALFITAAQLVLEYRRDLEDIRARFQVIQEGYLRSIEENVWLVDAQRLDTLLRGITSLRDFQFAEVRAEGRVLASSGRSPGADSIERRYPLTYAYRGRMVDTGELTVAASLGEVRARAWKRAGFILLANAAKTFLVALFIYFLVRRLIVRHVEALAERMRAVSTGQLSRGPLRIDRAGVDRKGEDEIDQLIGSFNDMGARLSTAIGNLEKLNEELEARVEARTRELLASNHGLRSALETLQRAQDEIVRNEKP
jgi:C4-dicarboxylate-specific signal transduction histidine kinase